VTVYKVVFNDSGFEPLPEGAYLVSITKCEEKTGKESGKLYLSWELTVQDGVYTGRKVWLNTSLLPEASWKIGDLLTALGESHASNTEMNLEPDDYLGRELVVTVTNTRMYEGKPQNDVDKLMPVPKKK